MSDLEFIRSALRGQRLPALARELGVEIPAIEAFVTDRANITPELLAGIVRILDRQKNIPAPARQQTVPQPVARNTMRLNARAARVSVVLDPAELTEPPGGAPRMMLQINVGGRIYGADIASKSIRKCRAAIAEHGAANVAVLLQGKLNADNTIAEAGIAAQVKAPRPEPQ